MGKLADRVVLITGAGSGIGRETARRAAAEGAAIAAIGLDHAALDALVAEVLAAGGRATARVADVSDEAAITAAVGELVADLGPLSVAHANAGILVPPTALEELDLDTWNRVLAVDLTGVMLTFRAALPHFGDAGGLLLATGSSLAVRPGTGLLPYVAAKAGVHGIARSLEVELAPRGIPGERHRPGPHRHADDARCRRPHRAPAGRRPTRPARQCGGRRRARRPPHDRRVPHRHRQRLPDRRRPHLALTSRVAPEDQTDSSVRSAISVRS